MADNAAIDAALAPAASSDASLIDAALGTPAPPKPIKPATPSVATLQSAFGYTPLSGVWPEWKTIQDEGAKKLEADILPDKGADTDLLHNLIYGVGGGARAALEGTLGFLAGKETFLATESAKIDAEALKKLGFETHPEKIDPEKAEQSVEDFLYYKPKTVVGQEMSKIASFPLQGASDIGSIISEQVYEANPDKPALAVIAGVLPIGLAMLTPFKDVGTSLALKTTEHATPLVRTNIDEMNAENARAVPPPKLLTAPKGDIDEALAAEKVMEKRVNTARRTKIDELLAQGKHEEVKAMIYRNDMTGLPNGRAFADDYISAPSPYIAFLDSDSLKFRNDTYGEAAGDEMIRRIGKTLKAQNLDAYRLNDTGDEFLVKGDTPAELNANLHKVADALELQTFPDGTAPRITWGIAPTDSDNGFHTAEANMRVQKVRREANGQKAARGATPPDYKGTDFLQKRQEQAQAVEDAKDPEAPDLYKPDQRGCQ